MSEMIVDDAALVEDGFNAADYVNDFLRNVRSGDEVKKLQQLRTALGAKNASSSEAIKDIVFERYRQFIDTSKEVSNLEREIYQLSTFLMDQKQLIENLMEKVGHEKRQTKNQSTNSVGHPVQNPLQVLMQKMDGVASVLNNLNENDRILLQNEVTLLNPDSMEEIHPILLVLLSDLLLIGYPADTMSKYRYELHSTHTLDNLAVVNVKRTVGSSKIPNEQILQFLIFPDQLYIKCDTPKIKREWFEGVEQAKRKQQHENLLHRQATIRAKRRSIIGNQGANASKTKQSVFSIEEEQDNNLEIEKQKSEELNQWLENLIGEVYDVISQREMEKAVEFINEWKESKCQDPVINSKWQAIERNVVKLLSDEVKSPGALHGNSNLLHRNMDLLIALDRSTYAMDLFLKRRSKALRNSADELAVSEEPLSYVKQISTIFVNGILDVAKEAYNQTNHLPQMLQFASSELKLLLNLIRRNVVEVAPTIAVLAHTWRILLEHCHRLSEFGLDLTFEVHRLLAPSLQSALENNFANIFESVKLRISEEKWRPYNLESELALNRYLEEMSDLGLSIDWAVTSSPKYSLNLASSACQFARVALTLSRDLGLLHSSHLDRLCDGFVVKLWKEFLSFLIQAEQKLKTLTNSSNFLTVHALTCQFLVSQVLPLCEETYDEGCGLLTELLHAEFPNLCEYVVKDEASSFEEEVANV